MLNLLEIYKFMRFKLLLTILILLILGCFLYFYIYKDHRDISSEVAAYTTTTDKILQDYKNNEMAANTKYLDETILITGKITDLDLVKKTIVLDHKLSGILNNSVSNVKINDIVSLKGRFIGFDELLEEIKMDEITIIK